MSKVKFAVFRTTYENAMDMPTAAQLKKTVGCDKVLKLDKAPDRKKVKQAYVNPNFSSIPAKILGNFSYALTSYGAIGKVDEFIPNESGNTTHSTMLFMFSDEVKGEHVSLLSLKYFETFVTAFQADENDIDEFHHCSWKMDRLAEAVRPSLSQALSKSMVESPNPLLKLTKTETNFFKKYCDIVDKQAEEFAEIYMPYHNQCVSKITNGWD
jgi:hypothetical protein